ncbi:hypothetical protein L6259_02250 [Candidatus Parcubacteria bacterium]|nr:hypothetical protein [Patescibacteria group bacterium]MCG2694071.1 hypothetical protein [Candidatus Parcubacteria bacterium]
MAEKKESYFCCTIDDLFRLIKDIAGFERWSKKDKIAFRTAIDDIYDDNEFAILYTSLSFSLRVPQAAKIVLMGKNKKLAKEEWLKIIVREWGEEWGVSWINRNKEFFKRLW